MPDRDEPQQASRDGGAPMPSRRLALLIVDALIDAGVVKKEDLERAVTITAEEIDARRGLTDGLGSSQRA